MSGLTTHVLDIASGQPAIHVKIELYMLRLQKREWLKTVVTNGDGRLDFPLLFSEEMAACEYELVFYIGDYFKGLGVKLLEPPFLDKVPVRFGISDLAFHYHVPLLISPYGYQVYRGS
ncbi:hydroxyisourate hydrolase [Ectobacillus sp. sgz5001026]|uniref:hydroxyisourate hydrolase n=1 Tax=Ectobacillus sp. sgz5001026 TaxID=3242473 RepID=UPI0036D3F15E